MSAAKTVPLEVRAVPRNERVVFATSVEALLQRGLGARLTPALSAKVKAAGIDLGKPLLPGYPSELWEKVVVMIARELHPDLSLEDAQWKLGESTVSGFEETLIGKAMVGLSKVIGPRRALLRFPSMSRTSNNFAHMTAEEISPTEIVFTLEPFEGLPQYVQGCLTAVIRMTGGKNPDVALVSHDVARERVVLRATWN